MYIEVVRIILGEEVGELLPLLPSLRLEILPLRLLEVWFEGLSATTAADPRRKFLEKACECD